MDRRTVAILICAFAIGGGVWLLYNQFSSEINTTLNPFITKTQDILRYIYAQWTALPEIVRNILLLGIPVAFSLFLAWTKSRAMQQLQNVQTYAQSQGGQLTSALNENKQLNDFLTKQDQVLRQSRSVIDTITAKDTQISQLNEVLSAKNDLIRVQQEYDTLKTTSTSMAQQLKELRDKYLIK